MKVVYKEIDENDIKEMILKNEEDHKFAEQCKRERVAQRKVKPTFLNMGEWLLDFEKDNYVDGSLIPFPHGYVIKQAEYSFYYRGENQIYPTSRPKLFREIDCLRNEDDKKVEYFISLMRIGEFIQFINNFDIVKKWYSDVLYEPLAQHYGLSTRWIDITSDFETALFFACCYYDGKINEWRPLTKRRIEKNYKSRYGVIFKRPASMAKMDLLFNTNLADYSGLILPIGFQPLMRCHMQHGYGILMKPNDDLQKNEKFEALRFKHNPKMSEWIFNRKGRGKLIYPQEGLSNFSDILDIIKTCKNFSESSFSFAEKESKFSDLNLADIKIKLKEKQINIGQTPFTISKERIDAVNKKSEDFDISKQYGIQLSYRKTFTPDSPSKM